MPLSITDKFNAQAKRKPLKRCICWGTGLLALLLVLAGCPGQREIKFAGKTMGTTYHITIVGSYFSSAAPLHKAVDERLEAINASMSTFRPDSEISRFNQMQRIDTPVPIGKDFQEVMQLARKLFEITQGAWDGTLDPLIDLWGFGRTQRSKDRIPNAEEIKPLLASVGFNHIVMHSDGHLSKRQASVSLDLASVAKGYAVDMVASLIGGKGFENYLVEIGGEVYAAGVRIDGHPWRIGINKPVAGAPFDQVYHVVNLQNRAFATSGDYRNFFEIDGQRYAHIIDPRTGYPVVNNVVSASVTADTCALADGLATALMVMGAAAGVELVNRMDGVECLIISRNEHGGLSDHTSLGFPTVN